MNGLASARGASSAALRVALLAAMLMFAAGTSQAAQDGGRGSGRGGRTHGGGSGRTHSGGSGRTHSDEGGRTYGGGGGRTYGGGGGRTYGGGGGTYIGGGGRAYDGGGRYYGGVRYDGPYGYRYIRPRTFVSFGIGLGVPYYSRPAYRYHVEPYPVEVESGTSIDVTNEPPAGCYYYDPFCDRQFSNLDEYTDHVESQDHAKTIEIVHEESGNVLRTLEFMDGYWIVRK